MPIAETCLVLWEFKAYICHMSVSIMQYGILICTHYIPGDDGQPKHVECLINTLFYSVLCQYVTVSPSTSKPSFCFLCLRCQFTVSKCLSPEFLFRGPDTVIFHTDSLLSISPTFTFHSTPLLTPLRQTLISIAFSVPFGFIRNRQIRQTSPFFLCRSAHFFTFLLSQFSLHIPLQH